MSGHHWVMHLTAWHCVHCAAWGGSEAAELPCPNGVTTASLLVNEADQPGSGAFGYAAMFRSGGYVDADRAMVAAKFEALGGEIDRLRAQIRESDR